MPTPNFVKYATTNQNGCLKSKNVLIAVTDIDYGPTSNTGFWNGVTPPANGYTIYTLPSGATTPSIVCPGTDTELIYWSQILGGTNISTVSDGLNYITTALTNSVVVNINEPNIVTSGLSLFLDAEYVPSYPSSGVTRWYDLSGNQYDCNMVGSVSFTDTSPKSFNYQNTPNYFSGTSSLKNSITSAITIISWAKITDISKRSVVFDEYETIVPYGYVFEVGTLAGLWTNTCRFFAQGQNNNYSMDYRGTTQFSQNVNYMFTVTFDYASRTAAMYLNTSAMTASNVGNATSLTSDWSQSGNDYTLGSYRPEVAIDSSMNQYNIMIYDRVLSLAEITQNFNALKSRFGL